MNIYTYVETIPEFPHERLLIALWESSWRRLGWNPVILTPADAARHPLSGDLEKHIATQLPSTNHPAYERACYLRWCALEVAGGGWMSDYDVINYSLHPEDNEPPGAGHLWFGHQSAIPARVCPCLVHGGAEDYHRAIRLFLDYRIDDLDLHERRPHVSDQRILRRHYSALHQEGWIRHGNVCANYKTTRTDWQSKATVHFPNKSMLAAGKMPRHEHISLDPAVRIRP